MARKPRSLKQTQAQLAAELRDKGYTWAEVGVEFRRRFNVNARVALRQARGWTQPEAAAMWNHRWPEDPKTFKNFSYWEAWPSSTGHAPSLDTLDRLARLYECSVADLVADLEDHGTARRRFSSAVVTARPLPEEPVAVTEGLFGTRGAVGPYGAVGSFVASGALGAVRAVTSAGSLASVERVISGAPVAVPLPTPEAPEPVASGSVSRRSLLLDMSSALAIAAAAPVLERPNAALGTPTDGFGRVDETLLLNTGLIVGGLRRQGGALGPAATLPTAMAVRTMVWSMAKDAPDRLSSRAWTIYGDMTQLLGWLLFNLGDEVSARYYYEDARSAAYRAENLDLASYTLAAMSQLATSQGKWQAGIEHAQASYETAHGSSSRYAVAYAADISARAYAAAGQVARCQAALDREQVALAKISAGDPPANWWYFYDKSFYWGTESECALRLGMPVEAFDAAGRSLDLVSPSNLHNSALTLTYQSEALVHAGDVTEACRALGDAARLATLNSSRRIARQIHRVRGEMREWEGTAAVTDLDAQLARYRRVGGSDGGGEATESEDDEA